jgi:hypothetical protein
MRSVIALLVLSSLVVLGGCSRASWTRADLFSTAESARSQHVVEGRIESVAFLGGVQRGLNITLDQAVETDQGSTRRIYLEQPVQLPVGIAFMRRVRVHFDLAGSPLFVEEIKPVRP